MVISQHGHTVVVTEASQLAIAIAIAELEGKAAANGQKAA